MWLWYSGDDLAGGDGNQLFQGCVGVKYLESPQSGGQLANATDGALGCLLNLFGYSFPDSSQRGTNDGLHLGGCHAGQQVVHRHAAPQLFQILTLSPSIGKQVIEPLRTYQYHPATA